MRILTLKGEGRVFFPTWCRETMRVSTRPDSRGVPSRHGLLLFHDVLHAERSYEAEEF